MSKYRWIYIYLISTPALSYQFAYPVGGQQWHLQLLLGPSWLLVSSTLMDVGEWKVGDGCSWLREYLPALWVFPPGSSCLQARRKLQVNLEARKGGLLKGKVSEDWPPDFLLLLTLVYIEKRQLLSLELSATIPQRELCTTGSLLHLSFSGSPYKITTCGQC